MRDHYAPNHRLTPQVTTAAEVATAPTLWAIPGLLPCHHLSAILAPTGTGLTQLAVQICAHLAPAPPSPVADLSGKSASDPDIPNLQSQIFDPPLPPSPSLALTPSSGPSPCHRVAASPCPSPTELEVHEDYPVPAVLFVGGREHAETLRTRLSAAGADLRRILILTGVTDGAYGDQIRRPVCGDNYNIISDLLDQHRGIRLVIIDNAEDLFCDSNRIKRNRLLRQLACFRMVAEKWEANICLLANVPQLDAHPCRTTFLSCIREVCRAVHLLTPDLPQHDAPAPDPSLTSDLCPLTSSSTHRLLITIKNTLASTCPTLRLNLFGLPSSGSSFILQPSSLGSSPATLTYPHYLSLLRNPTGTRGPRPIKLDYACQVLIELLKHGPLPVGNYKKPLRGTIARLTEEAGVAWNTAQRAMVTLNITAFQFKNRWYWQLPETIPHGHPQPAQQLAQETSLSDSPNDAQPSPAQEDIRGRATHEGHADTRDTRSQEMTMTTGASPTVRSSSFSLSSLVSPVPSRQPAAQCTAAAA